MGNRFFHSIYWFVTPSIGLSCFRRIYCNNAIHWISYWKSSIYYFDLNTECINKSPLPPHLVGHVRHFGESRGHLQLISIVGRSYSHREFSLIYIYESKRDYSGWSLKYQVDLAFVASAFPKKINSAIRKQRCTVLSILVDEKEDLTMVLQAYGMFVACNFKKKLCNVLRHDDDPFRMYNAHQYIETLACV